MAANNSGWRASYQGTESDLAPASDWTTSDAPDISAAPRCERLRPVQAVGVRNRFQGETGIGKLEPIAEGVESRSATVGG